MQVLNPGQIYTLIFFNNFVWKSNYITKKFLMLKFLELSSCNWKLNLTLHRACPDKPDELSLSMAHTNYSRERRGNFFLPIRKSFYNALQAVLAWQHPALGKRYSIQPNCGFLFHLYWCVIHFFLFNIIDSVACYANGVHRPKHPLKIYCLLASSKMIIKEWFRLEGTLENHLVQIPPLPKAKPNLMFIQCNVHYTL